LWLKKFDFSLNIAVFVFNKFEKGC
jgi:hypothetical protein